MREIYHLMKIAELISITVIEGGHYTPGSEFDKWVHKSPGNLDLYNRIIDKKNIENRNSLYSSINTSFYLYCLLSDINKKQTKLKWIKRSRQIAAVFLVLLIGSFYFFLSPKTNQKTEITQCITPGEKGAVLIMNNGNSIDLKNELQTKLTEADGTLIKNTQGELLYSPNKFKTPSSDSIINTLITARGKEYKLVLSDGTKVFVNSMSQLKYPVQFTGAYREVTLEGEACFDVKKDSLKPFIVNSNGIKIEVLGTSFNIKAYSDESDIAVTLIEGLVEVNITNKQDQTILLHPNQQVVLNNNNSEVVVHTVDSWQYISWTKGLFYFKNEPLLNIVKTLSRWYKFEYEFEDESLQQIRFEGKLNKYKSINPIWDIVESTGKVNIKTNGNKITFMHK